MENNTIKRVQRPPKGGVKINKPEPIDATPKEDINANSVKNVAHDTPTSSSLRNKKGLFIGIGVTALVVLAIGAFFLFRSPINIETSQVDNMGLEATLYKGVNTKTDGYVYIMWPEGETPIAQNIRDWIYRQLEYSTALPPKKMMEEKLESIKLGNSINLRFDPFEDDFIIVSMYRGNTLRDVAYFRKSDGAQLTNDILRSVSSDYLLLVLDSINDADLSQEDRKKIDSIDYGALLTYCYPYFSEKGLENRVIYGDTNSSITDFKLLIPYETILGVASEEILKFIPEKYLNEFAQKGEELTTGLVKKLAKQVLPQSGPSPEIISDEFAKICSLGNSMPGYLEWIGEEEIMSCWHGGQEADNNWSVKNVDFKSVSNNQALVNVDYVHYGYQTTIPIKFVTKNVELPSGITTSKWVIDDFNNMKAQILEAVRQQYENLSKKTPDEIFTELLEEGINLPPATKESYKSEYEKFFELYQEYNH
ncbi:MAG: hypothetical protein J1F20_06025 [Muribaculaceae bacterium]|nr:hypothetical protein [Muribaculaceae bacterium]